MKTARLPARSKRGFTLLEMTIVIMVLLALVKIGLFTSSKMDEWKLARASSETLRSVYSAQRMYLADNPTTLVANLTDAMLIPYLPNRNPADTAPADLVDAFETVKPLSGAALGFNVATSPPYFVQAGVRYDPSGSYTDSLWDVGE
jgi:prepilin-type N-terminal cleavage/methylation domain-containing protein